MVVGELAPIAVVGALLAATAALTWRTWGDFGRGGGLDLFVGEQLSAGHRLYSGVSYDRGPLAPSAIAAAFSLFGVGLGQAIALGLGLTSLAALAAYGLAREVVGRIAAAACAAIAVTGIFLLPGPGNLVLPDDWSSALAAVLILLGVLACLRSLTGGPVWWAAAGGCAGLVLLTRPSWLFVLVLSVAATGASSRRRDLVTRITASVAAAGVVIVLGALLLPASRITAPRSSDVVRAAPAPAGSLGHMLLHAAVYALVALILVGAAKLLRGRRLGWAAIVAVGLASVLAGPLSLAKALHSAFGWLGLLGLVVATATAPRALGGNLRSRDAKLLVLGVATISAAAIDVRGYAPGGVAAGLLPLGLALVGGIQVREQGGGSSARLATAWLGLLAAGGLVVATHDAAARTVTIASFRGEFRALPADGWALKPALAAIDGLGSKPRLYVAADSGTYLFLSGARPLDGWDGTRTIDDSTLAGLVNQTPPDALVVPHRGEGDVSDGISRALRRSFPSPFTYTGSLPARLELTVLTKHRESDHPNQIASENARVDGLSSTAWQLHEISTAVEGYATTTSVDTGTPIRLRVSTKQARYTIDVWRAGWYGAPGVMRRFATFERRSADTGARANAERGCGRPDPRTGYLRCAWRTTDTIATRGWPTGIYLVNFRSTGGMSQTVVVVRDDASRSDILYQASTTTWQAYNAYGGKSLYTFNSTGADTIARTPRAVEVSFDRPYANPGQAGYNWFLRSELPLVVWLERNGYDVSYSDDVATAQHPLLLRRHRVFVVSGHDEYWSQAMRDAVTQARDHGISLAVFSSNTAYWRVRLPDDGRTLVCYKTVETAGAAEDPVSPTTLWRDPRGPNDPENALLGAMYVGDNDTNYFPLVVQPRDDPLLRHVFTGTRSTLRLGSSLVGWEWDSVVHNGRTPPGLRILAASPAHGELLTVGKTTRYVPGAAVVTSTIYRARSGALVFDAATDQWAWGLEPVGYVDATGFERTVSRLHLRAALNRMGITRATYTGPPNAGAEIPAVAQLTYNILAAMGARPALPRASPALVLSGS
jgi:hypothetical protein